MRRRKLTIVNKRRGRCKRGGEKGLKEKEVNDKQKSEMKQAE